MRRLANPRATVILTLLAAPAFSLADDSPRPSLAPPSERRATQPSPPRATRSRYQNPGGVGRRAERSPAGGTFQDPGRGAHRIASFGESPGFTSRATQLEARKAGNEQVEMTYRHMDAYGRPMFWFWFPFVGARW